MEPMELSVKKNWGDEGNVYHRKLLERRLTVAVWRHGESVATERMMINQPQPLMWNRDIHYALSSINYAADKQTHHIYCAHINSSWIIELETLPFRRNTAQISDEKYFIKKIPDFMLQWLHAFSLYNPVDFVITLILWRQKLN